MTPYIDYNHDIEKHVLACCLAGDGVYVAVHHLLTEQCFHNMACLQVYEAMHTVWESGLYVDALSVSQQLHYDGCTLIDGLSPGAYVGLLCSEASATPHLAEHCVQLRELAARRVLLRITQQGFSAADDVTETAAQIQQLLTDAMQVRTVNDWHDARHIANELCHALEHPDTQDDNSISTTFDTIDALNGKLRPGQLIVLGARPAMGKSALAGNIALAAAWQGRQVGFVSMEMPARELLLRMISHHTGVHYKNLERPAAETLQHTTALVRRLAALPLHFADSASLTIHDIRARAQQLKQSKGLHLLVVDYLQLIAEHADARRSREQNISAISRGLKMIAMQLQVPVIALSQLNRESEHRSNRRPTLADLRESGAIEQDADIVLLLHRDYRSGVETDADGNSTRNTADLIIAKWRNGTCFDLKLHFEPETMRFTQADDS